MTSAQKWVLRVLQPRTSWACFFWFLPFVICQFFLGVVLIFLWVALGFGEPSAIVTTPLFWVSLFLLWKALFLSTKDLKAFWLAEDARVLDRRIASLERSAMRGDPAAAKALGDIYGRRDGAAAELKRALHYLDIASAKLPSAKLKASAIRRELADVEVKKQRAELEAEVPDILNATCPNCAGLLGMSSVKCHHCGALFATAGAGWGPISIAVQIPTDSDLLTKPSAILKVKSPLKKPGLPQQSSNSPARRIAHIFLWSAHLCVVVAVFTIALGYPNAGLARLILVAPFLYFAWAIATAFAGHFKPRKSE